MKKGYKKRVGSYSGRVDFFLLIGIVVIAVFGFCSYLYISNDGASEERCFSYRDTPEKWGVEIVDYDVGSCGKSPIIPTFLGWKPVLSIGEGAFRNKGIVSIVLPKILVRIENWAFDGNQLTSVIFPRTLEYIGTTAFQKNALTSVVIPGSVNVVGVNAFGWNVLQNVIIEDGVVVIDQYAFQNNNLYGISLPSTIESVGMMAFVDNPLFAPNIHIGNPYMCLGDSAFIIEKFADKKDVWKRKLIEFQSTFSSC